MFTGIINHTGIIESLEKLDSGARLRMRVRDETGRNDRGASCTLRHLEFPVGGPAQGPADPRPVESPAHFLLRGAGCDARFVRPRRRQDAAAERSERHAIHRALEARETTGSTVLTM